MMEQVQKIARFVASHDMPMVRVVGDAVEFACDKAEALLEVQA